MKLYIPQSVMPENQIESYLIWPLENIMEVEKQNSNLYSLTVSDTQSIIAIFCKIILSFLGQKLTQNYLRCFLTPWNMSSHVYKAMLS